MGYLSADKKTLTVILQALNECLAQTESYDKNPDYLVLKEIILSEKMVDYTELECSNCGKGLDIYVKDPISNYENEILCKECYKDV